LNHILQNISRILSDKCDRTESQVFLTDLLIYVGGPTPASPVEVPR